MTAYNGRPGGVTLVAVIAWIGGILQAFAHPIGDVVIGSVITALLAALGIGLLYTARANQFSE